MRGFKQIQTMLKLGLAGVFVFAGFVLPTLASDLTNWNYECQRRNISYGCNCDCRGVEDAAGNVTIDMCSGEIDDLRGIGPSTSCSIRGRFDSNGVGTKLGSGRADPIFNINPFTFTEGGIVKVRGGELQVGETIAAALQLLFIIIGILAILLGFYGSFKYSTAGDNDDQVTEARSIIKNALIGFFIALAGATIATILAGILQFNATTDLDFDTPTNQDGTGDEFFDNLFD